MRKTKRILHMVISITAVVLIITISSSYAMFEYRKGKVDNVTTTLPKETLEMKMNIPTKGLTITTEGITPNNTQTSDNLYGPSQKDFSDRKDYLIKNYQPFEIGIQNLTDNYLYITFELDFCLAPDLIGSYNDDPYINNTLTNCGTDPWDGNSHDNYPFQDPYTISRNSNVIGQGNVYFPATWYSQSSGTANITNGNVKLKKQAKAFDNKVLWLFGYDYYHYTATIDPIDLQDDPNYKDNLSQFVIEPNNLNTDVASFVLSFTHKQYNTNACYASIKVTAHVISEEQYELFGINKS